jgi:hypothetical protein
MSRDEPVEIVDPETLEVNDENLIDLRNADPMVIMKAAAEGMGFALQDPKPNCKKCHGRGFLGRKADTGEPIPCTCIFPTADRSIGNVPFINTPRNRKERRHGI